jgi:tryptophan synthase beta chain
MVREFQSVIGREARAQMLAQAGRLPTAIVACVGGGSNAIGVFHAFVPDEEVRLIGVEPGGRGIATGQHGAALVAGTPGLLHGARTYVLQDDEGQILEAHSVSAGLDYPGVGPEHAFLRDRGRARYVSVTDEEAIDAFEKLSELEGIIPAFEPAHALAFLLKAVRERELPEGAGVLLNLCGRGDKDLESYFRWFRRPP